MRVAHICSGLATALACSALGVTSMQSVASAIDAQQRAQSAEALSRELQRPVAPQPIGPAQETVIILERRYELDDLLLLPSYSGMSPKQWGQYLQSRGLQVWTKGSPKGRKSSKNQKPTDACKTA